MEIAICDGDHSYLQNCIERIKNLGKKYDCFPQVTTYLTGEQLLFALDDKKKIDLVYIEYCLPGKDGMEVARQLRKNHFVGEIIFLTTYGEKWHSAFDLEAIHYLVKGETEDQYFESSFARALERVRKKKDERIVFTCANESRNISIADIQYFEVKRNVVTVHYGEQNVFEFYTPLSKLQTALERYKFIKSHQSYLVALRYISEVRKEDILLGSGDVVPLSRTYRKVVNDALSQRDGN